MDRLDDENLVLDEDDEVLRIIHKGRWILGTVMLVIFALFVSGWLLRKGVAERAMSTWCEQQSLICMADFDEVGPDGASLSNLEIRAGGDIPLRADKVQAVLEWPGIFQPKLKSVTISEPVLRGQFKNGRLSLFGLEKLAKGSGGGGGRAPQVEVINGHVVIDTDAGDVTAKAMIKGALPQNGEVILTLDPADLTGPEGRIQWSGGDINLFAKEGRLDGIITLRLETAALKGFTLNGAALEARIETDSELDLLSIVDLSGEVEEAIWTNGMVSRMAVSGSAILDGVPKLSVADVRAALLSLTYDVKADQFGYSAYNASKVDFAGALKREQTVLSGSVGLTASDVSAPQGKIGSLALTGMANISKDQGTMFDGRGAVERVVVGSDYRRKITNPIKFPSVLSDHGNEMRGAVDRLLRGFDTSIEFHAEKRDAQTVFRADKLVTVTGNSGAKVFVEPLQAQPWISYRNGDFELAGIVNLSGGGLPNLSANVDSLKRVDTKIELDAHRVHLAPWTASERTISGDVPTLLVSRTNSGIEINASGTLGSSGAFPGVNLQNTQLKGRLKASSQDKRWTVSQVGSACVDIDTEGLQAGAVEVGEMVFSACPDAGRFLRNGQGSLKLGDMLVPFTTGKSNGALSLAGATIDYDAQKGISLSVLADELKLPMMLGARSFLVEGEAPRLGIITGQGPPRLSARLGQTRFGGEVIPAELSAAAFTFDGAMPESGVSGALTANSVVVEDKREDPIYQPLITDLDAKLVNGRLRMSAPLRLKKGGITVAEADVDIDIFKLDGEANVRTRTLTFKDGGLQPHMLSDRLRGFFTTATGALEGRARLMFAKGKVSGTGRVQVTGFGFQTQRLGRVVGVNGIVDFIDLLDMTTAPGQVVTVRSMNPGVPLQNGRLGFQLVGGKMLKVSEAVFPFAGGKMTLLPLDWELGGKTQRFEVVASQIELEQLISTLQLPDVQATGTVSGRFPISIDDTKILIQDAKLVAGPQGGQLAYTGEVGDRAAQAGDYGEMAFEALKDLKFSVLELGVNGNVAGDMRVDLLLVGKNKEVLNGQPFEFDISIDSKLAELIQSRLYYANQDWLETIASGELPGGGKVDRDE